LTGKNVQPIKAVVPKAAKQTVVQPTVTKTPVKSEVNLSRREYLLSKWGSLLSSTEPDKEVLSARTRGIRTGTIRAFKEREKASWELERAAIEGQYHAEQDTKMYVEELPYRHPVFEVRGGKTVRVGFGKKQMIPTELTPALVAQLEANFNDGQGFRAFRGSAKRVWVTQRATIRVSKLHVPLDWFERVSMLVPFDQKKAVAALMKRGMVGSIESAYSNGKLKKAKVNTTATPKKSLAPVAQLPHVKAVPSSLPQDARDNRLFPMHVRSQAYDPPITMPEVEDDPPWMLSAANEGEVVVEDEAPVHVSGLRGHNAYLAKLRQKKVWKKTFKEEHRQMLSDRAHDLVYGGAVQYALGRKEHTYPSDPRAEGERYNQWFEERLSIEEQDAIRYELYWGNGQVSLDQWFLSKQARSNPKLEAIHAEMPDYCQYATTIPAHKGLVPAGESQFHFDAYAETTVSNLIKSARAGSSVHGTRYSDLSGGVGVESSAQVVKASALNDWKNCFLFAGFKSTPTERSALRAKQAVRSEQCASRANLWDMERHRKTVLVRAWMNAKPRPVAPPVQAPPVTSEVVDLIPSQGVLVTESLVDKLHGAFNGVKMHVNNMGFFGPINYAHDF